MHSEIHCISVHWPTNDGMRLQDRSIFTISIAPSKFSTLNCEQKCHNTILAAICQNDVFQANVQAIIFAPRI